jgi:surfeit locus 1 family protein
MLRRMIIPALFGLLGCWILVSLGLWQLDSADQKAALIAEMEGRILKPPNLCRAVLDARGRSLSCPWKSRAASLPDYMCSFSLRARSARAGLSSGAGIRGEDGRRIMVERGFLPEAARG